jgi:hypothetical protein
MFRLIAILAVIGAFGATLYYAGGTLEAWEAPQPPVEPAAAAPKKNAKRAKRARKARQAKKSAPRVPGHILRLEALCRRAEAASDKIRPPSSPEDAARYFGQYARLGEQWNDRAAALLRRSPAGDSTQVRRLLRLFDREETLVRNMLSASRSGDFSRLGGLSNQLLAVARAENRILIRMDAIACTISPDVFRL